MTHRFFPGVDSAVPLGAPPVTFELCPEIDSRLLVRSTANTKEKKSLRAHKVSFFNDAHKIKASITINCNLFFKALNDAAENKKKVIDSFHY